MILANGLASLTCVTNSILRGNLLVFFGTITNNNL